MSRPHESAVRVAVVHPDLLGTYGDGGNGVVLAERLRWRGIPAEVIEIRSGDPVPATCDVYCLGGGEDGPEARSALELLDGRPLNRAVAGGAVVLPDPGGAHDPAHWSALIERHGVTVWNSVPALLQSWLDARRQQPATSDDDASDDDMSDGDTDHGVAGG